MKNDAFRTDLAFEGRVEGNPQVPGVSKTSHKVGSFTVVHIHIKTEEGANVIGKPIGTYVTVSSGKLQNLDAGEKERLTHLLAGQLRGMAKKMTGKKVDGNFSVLVVGLGNTELTSDAIGPKTVLKIKVTRHISVMEPNLFQSLGSCIVAGIVPGVVGQTGIETFDTVQQAVKMVAPDLVIVVDALAARSCELLSSTVQLSTNGLRPGAGVGNQRKALTQESLKVPVMSVGVPTVVDSATLCYDLLEKAGMREITAELKERLNLEGSFFVTPKDCDEVTSVASEILSDAVNFAFSLSE